MPETVLETPAAVETPVTTPAAVTPAALVPPAVAPVPPVPGVPETYTLTLPDGSVLDAKVLEQVTPLAKALKAATDADAQSIVGLLDATGRELLQTYETARAPGGAIHAELVKVAAAMALADPDLGNGDPAKFERAQLKAGLVLNQYQHTGIGEALKARGYLTVPELKFLNAIADAMSESSHVSGAPILAPRNQPWERQMYEGGIKLSSDAPASV